MKELYKKIRHLLPKIKHCLIFSLTLLQIQKNLQRLKRHNCQMHCFFRINKFDGSTWTINNQCPI